jgi:hypothetical protein
VSDKNSAVSASAESSPRLANLSTAKPTHVYVRRLPRALVFGPTAPPNRE